jgi:hypothetical protein
LDGNPIACAEIDALASNSNIDVVFNSECQPAGAPIDGYKYDAPNRDYVGYYYRLDTSPNTFPSDLSGDQYQMYSSGGFVPSSFGVIVGQEDRFFEYVWVDNDPSLAVPYDVESIHTAWVASVSGLTIKPPRKRRCI